MPRIMRTTSLIIILATALLFSSDVQAGDIEDNLTYQGNKARITVGTIKDKAKHFSAQEASAIGEMLSTSLTNTGKFIVLASQEEVAELAEEINLAQSGYVEEGRGPEKGLMEGADILITGAVTSFEPDAGGGGGALGGLTKKAFGSVGVSKKEAKITLDIKLIDIRTRRIIKAKTIKAKSTKWKTGMKGGGWVDDVALVGSLGQYSNEPMADAVRCVLAKSIEEISKQVPKEYYRYSGQGQYTKEYGQSGSQDAPATSSGSSSGSSQSTTSSGSGTSTPVAAEDMTLYTKYDFIPGNRVIFYDDLSDEEEGEFPFRWNLNNGVFEIARMGGEYWILCTDAGSIVPKTPVGPLPEMYTVEMEIYGVGPEFSQPYFYIQWLDTSGKRIGQFQIRSTSTSLQIQGKELASKLLRESLSKGVHTMRIMATKRSIKCFINQVRVANVPRIEGFNPVGFNVFMDPYNKEGNYCMIKSFRFAEGGKSMRDQLDEDGKIVTHGILFDPGSHTIKGESFKTLKLIGRLFEDDSELRLSIEGHTDSDGSEADNSELSHNRSKAVVNYLIQTYGINADRLESRGWGESKPIDTNDTPEGKANNRRVELVKK